MTKKRFYYLLGCHPRSAHPGRFEITELWDVNKIRVLWISILLMFKNESILCVDTREPARSRMGRAGAFEKLEFLRETYQRWYDEWWKKKEPRPRAIIEIALNVIPIFFSAGTTAPGAGAS